MAKILLVEDDKHLVSVLKSDLEYEGYSVTEAMDVKSALEAFKPGRFDLILLDISLPDGTGYDVCRNIRKADAVIPVLFLTARSQQADKIFGFKLGADDYISKPFSVVELLARIKARLRSRGGVEPQEIKIGSLSVSLGAREVKVSDNAIALTPKEFDILWFLANNQGRVISRDEFLEKIWGVDAIVSTRTIDNQVGTLRQKLEAAGSKKCPEIITLHKVGYKLVKR